MYGTIIIRLKSVSPCSDRHLSEMIVKIKIAHQREGRTRVLGVS